jgi:HlyD family secretion protein
MKNSILLGLPFLLFSCGKKEAKEPSAKVNTAKLEVKEVVGIANVEPLQRIVQISPEVSGTVTGVNFNLNDHVKKGQTLLLMDDKVEQAQVAQAQSKLRTQQAVIQNQQSNLEALRVNLADAKNKYERNERQLLGNAVTQQVRDDSKFAYDNFIYQVKASESNLAQQKAKLNELQADLNYYQTLLDKKSIEAPTDGTILSVDVKIGGFIDNKTSIADFAPSGPLIAVTEIDELFANRIRVGQAAYIRPQGDTVNLSPGKVILTAPYLKKKSLFSDNANNLEDRRVREVRVQLDSDKILIGSRVECVIKIQ